MGQKVSIADDEENELFNLFKLRQYEVQQKPPEKGFLDRMLTMAPVLLSFQKQLTDVARASTEPVLVNVQAQ